MSLPQSSPYACSEGAFPKTRWSLVLEAQEGETEQAEAALHELCERYWKPLYIFVRSKGHDPPAAEDAVQGFFEKLLRTESWRHLEAAKGRLRSFLLQSMRYHLSNAAAKETALKRGGGKVFCVDFAEVENDLQRSQCLEDGPTPDVLFDQRWASAVLDGVMASLRAEFEARGKGELFAVLYPLIPEKGERGLIKGVAAELDLPETDVRLKVHRLRKRYRALLRQEISHTVATPEEVDDEIRALIQLFASV